MIVDAPVSIKKEKNVLSIVIRFGCVCTASKLKGNGE
jgi:hypothetical protein